jgi:hypothetical protein
MCCDLCNPELFNQTRPSKPIAVSRQQNVKKGAPVRDALFAWRRVVKRQFYPRALWAPHAILDDATCELLSSVGPIKTHERLALILKSGWARWDELGEHLFQMISELEIPPVSATTKRTGNTANTTKRRAVPSTDTNNSLSALAGPESDHPAMKRARTSVQPGETSTVTRTSSLQSTHSSPLSSYDEFFVNLCRS